ncbi:MAG: hypothetical protein ACI9VR_002731 [Cognaticolwellia sp.]
MLFALLIACQSAEPSWSGLFSAQATNPDCPPVAAAEGVTGGEPDTSSPFGKKPQVCIDDPFACDSEGNVLPDEPAVVEVEEPEVLIEVVPEPEPEPLQVIEPELPPAEGLATQAAWGVRLLQTMPSAQPPRAALGLPDGTEIIVSPGSMLPQAGIIVISVSADKAQLAKIEPQGDHAKIETMTLFAQY